ncbi:hypothetical protein CW304_20570 [Bacillus sp. UFRGS-B20]|nr:hypothetical protein CW304_20570 [Bacillus sp. UFRGS-B20]
MRTTAVNAKATLSCFHSTFFSCISSPLIAITTYSRFPLFFIVPYILNTSYQSSNKTPIIPIELKLQHLSKLKEFCVRYVRKDTYNNHFP